MTSRLLGREPQTFLFQMAAHCRAAATQFSRLPPGLAVVTLEPAMKTLFGKGKISGFTLVELFIALALLAVAHQVAAQSSQFFQFPAQR